MFCLQSNKGIHRTVISVDDYNIIMLMSMAAIVCTAMFLSLLSLVNDNLTKKLVPRSITQNYVKLGADYFDEWFIIVPGISRDVPG